MTTMVVSPGVASSYPTLKITKDGAAFTANTMITVATLQDVTVNAGKDQFTYTQLNNAGKLVIPTTASNSINGNIVVDDLAFWGDSNGTASSACADGIFKLSAEGTKVDFEFEFDAATGTGKKLTGEGYIVGIAPTVSPDSPVWVTPITIQVVGSYTIAALS